MGYRSTIAAVVLIVAACESTPYEPRPTPINVFTLFGVTEGLADDSVTDIVVDNIRNRVWFGTLNSVSYYSQQDSTIHTFDVVSGLPDFEINSIALEPYTGSIWAGTVAGAAVLSDSIWVPVLSLTNRFINDIQFAYNHRWIATREGLIRIATGGNTVTFTTQHGLLSDNVNSVESAPFGYLWVGTTSGITVYDATMGYSVAAHYSLNVLPNTNIRKIFQSADGSMWVGTSNGVAVFFGHGWKIFDLADGLPSMQINDFAQAGSSVWVATDGGVAWFDGFRWRKLTLPPIVSAYPATSLAYDNIRGELWIGTTAGVVRWYQE